MTHPVFSILTVVGGPEAGLSDLIDSVRAQSFGDWELIVVDFSGTARAVAEKYGDERIRLVHTDTPGFGDGVNLAVTLARGAVYTVVRPRHTLLPAFCERTFGLLEAHPEVDVVAVDAVGFDASGVRDTTTFRAQGGVTTEPGFDHAVTLAAFVAGSVLYYSAAIRSAAWRAGGGYPDDLPTVEGLLLFARMLAHGSDIRVLPETLAGYRVPEDPAVHRVYQDSVQLAFARIGELTDDPEVRRIAAGKARDIRFHQAMGRAREALARSDAAAARQQVGIALRQRFALKPAAVYAVLTIAPGGLRLAQSARNRLRAA
ncbi:glycosyltransferase family 2 protein [Nocardia sp. 2]|uniref:Glycosyltransferase family 2 protein n=1 Tax=Nocardia acididurans TaxID=2802282 RepID=A0ABS1M750_9NOCA|nr:glycosyltransferase family 2 protein [Nocardia acididurans]MBL1076411.1 glycosyltransferase family 2 protein [Nocardia acididurans]